jgi:hypothetical protein
MKKLGWISLFTTLALLLTAIGAAAAVNARSYRAVLSGGPDGTDSTATGKAQVAFSPDGQSLRYVVFVKDLNNTTQAHIHVAPTPGANGPIVLFLYPDAPPPVLIPGFFTGLLGKRSVTSADLIGPLQGMTLEDLRTAINEGRAYVNVHTTTFPAGEIRGDLIAVKKSK